MRPFAVALLGLGGLLGVLAIGGLLSEKPKPAAEVAASPTPQPSPGTNR